MQAGRGAPPPAPPVRQRGGALAVFPSTLIKKRPSDWTASFDMADSVLPTTAAGRLGKTARRKTTPVPGVRAPGARARRSRAVFRLPAGAARHAKADVPPLWELPIRFRRLAGRGIAPVARRRAGCCTPVRSSVAGCRRLWPKANWRRRGGQGDLAAGHPYRESGPQGRVREADSSRGRGAERPRAAVARSALRAQPGQAAQAPCGFFPPFLVRTRNGAARRGGTRQLCRSLSGKPMEAPCRWDPAIPAAKGGSFRASLRDAKKPSAPRAETPRRNSAAPRAAKNHSPCRANSATLCRILTSTSASRLVPSGVYSCEKTLPPAMISLTSPERS